MTELHTMVRLSLIIRAPSMSWLLVRTRCRGY